MGKTLEVTYSSKCLKDIHKGEYKKKIDDSGFLVECVENGVVLKMYFYPFSSLVRIYEHK